jgi:hypothetical protein
MSKSSEGSEKKFSNYLRGSSLSKGDKLILAGSALAKMDPKARKRLVGESIPKMGSPTRSSKSKAESGILLNKTKSQQTIKNVTIDQAVSP